MAGVAVPGPIRSLLNIVGYGIPVIRQSVEIILPYSGFLEGRPHSGNESQCRELTGFAGIVSQYDGGARCGAFAKVAGRALPVPRRGMASAAGNGLFVYRMGFFSFLRG